MSLLTHFNSLIFVFFVFGLAPHRTESIHAKLKRRPYLLPVIISLVFNVSIIGLQLYFDHPQSFGKINSIITVASLLSGLVFNLSAVLQCYFHPVVYQNIMYQIIKIEKTFCENFSENIPSASFAARYRWKVLIISSLAIISGILTIVILLSLLNIEGITIGVLETIITIFSVFIIIHKILFIDIAGMYLKTLNLNIKNSPLFLHTAMKIDFMKHIKLMHIELWKLVMQINNFFSWSLLYFTIDFMISLVYDLHKIFRVLQSGMEIKWTSAGLAALLFDSVSLVMVVNSCHYCSLEVKYLIGNIEQFAFWTNDDIQLYHLKHKVLSQIRNFPLSITASGFFDVNRQHLAGICATCCTYIIIFIQFFLSVEE